MNSQLDRQAASIFLAWRNRVRGSRYCKLEPAREALDLRTGDWDFIASDKGADGWLAIEVKEITVAESRKLRALWKKVFDDVTRDAHHVVEGTFLVTHMPKLYGRVGQKRLKHFEGAICAALAELRLSLAAASPGDSIDIWPAVRNNLQCWPIRDLYGETKRLELLKKSDGGHTIRWQGGPSYLLDMEKRERRAVKGLFRATQGKVKADTQLAIARGLGASETIWAIRGILEYTEHLRESLAATDGQLLSNTDTICLVDIGMKTVRVVWEHGRVVSSLRHPDDSL